MFIPHNIHNSLIAAPQKQIKELAHKHGRNRKTDFEKDTCFLCHTDRDTWSYYKIQVLTALFSSPLPTENHSLTTELLPKTSTDNIRTIQTDWEGSHRTITKLIEQVKREKGLKTILTAHEMNGVWWTST